MTPASDFVDEATPLPAAPGVSADPHFPTGRLPRIDAAAAGIYPRLVLGNLCESAGELGTLLAPYLDDDTTLLVHSESAPEAGRYVVELRCADGQAALVGVADLEAADGPHGRPAVRAAFVSIDPLSAELLEAMTAERAALRAAEAAARGQETMRMLALPGDGSTRRMSPLDLATLMNATAEQVKDGWDNRLWFRELSEPPARALPAPTELPTPGPAPGSAANATPAPTERVAALPSSPPLSLGVVLAALAVAVVLATAFAAG